ncbi:MAG: hypothetical protein GC168_16960 [Candidatus Hydrogenedens sp.]|nr:hypothetical protein [Candidatus Hydrogenedens sp.]
MTRLPERIGTAPAALLLLAVGASCWRAWSWCAAAWFDPGYSHGGRYASLLAAIAMAASLAHARVVRLQTPWLAAAGIALLAFAAAYAHVPRPVAALLAALALSTAWLGVSRGASLAGRWGLAAVLPLSLPLGVGAELYAGFPLRLLATRAAAWALGPGVKASGTALENGIQSVFVDAPCAGISMLDTALLLAAVAAAVVRADALRTALLLVFAAVLAVFGNIARAALLYIVETNAGSASISHDALGLAIFATCCALLIAVLLRVPPERMFQPDSTPSGRYGGIPVSVAVSLLLVAGLVSAAATRTDIAWAADRTAEPERELAWPATWQGRVLELKPIDTALETFLKNSPVQAREFTVQGANELVLLRQAPGLTRSLHPSETCFRGFGWQCSPRPAHRDAAGRLWSSFEARRSDGSAVLVREIYLAVPDSGVPASLDDLIADASTWPDAGSWFWSALTRGTGRTLAITHTLPIHARD